MRLHGIGILLCCASMYCFSQVYTISGLSESQVGDLYKNNVRLYQINADAYLCIGKEITRYRSLKYNKIDSMLDTNSHYFVLYPIRVQDMKSLARYGRVLYGCPEYVIFKTKLSSPFDIPVFDAYEKVEIDFNTPYIPPAATDLKNSQGLYRAEDPKVKAVVDKVTEASYFDIIGRLVKMERYATDPAAKKWADTLKAILESYKFDEVMFHSFGSNYAPNIIAVKNGSVSKDSIYCLGGHWDTYTKGAQGADDNGSGAAGVLEAARVLSQCNFKKSIYLILFSAEELSLVGSKALASKYKSENKIIAGLINFDVMAWRKNSTVQIDIGYNASCKDMFTAYSTFIKTYLPASVVVYDGSKSMYIRASDHASFWDQGYKAIICASSMGTDNFNSNMHTSRDVLSSLTNREQPVAQTKAAVAALASWAEILDITPIVAGKPGTGSSPELNCRQIKGRLSIAVNNPGVIRVFNAQGRVLFARTATNTAGDFHTFDVSALPSGIMYVAYESRTGAMVKCISIVK